METIYDTANGLAEELLTVATPEEKKIFLKLQVNTDEDTREKLGIGKEEAIGLLMYEWATRLNDLNKEEN